MKEYKNFINGIWVTGSTGLFFENCNPADTTDIIGKFPESGSADVDAAVTAARNAFDAWRLMPAPKRGDILRKAGDIFTRRKDELAGVMTREMGKTLTETRGDIQEAIDTAYYAATETRRLFGHTVPSEMNNKVNLSFRMPIGVCGIITAWNFPIAVPSWKILPALACGNTVVIKPSEDSPHSMNIFAEILQEAGVPAGVFNVIHGSAAAGSALVEHPDVALIGFTGSTTTGKAIAERCGALNKRVSLEMGGKNAQIVMDDANLELALDGVLWGAFGTTGQRCTATSRLIVHENVHDTFVDMLCSRAKTLVLGDGRVEGTQVGPVINEKQFNKILKYIEIGKSEATCILGGGVATQGGCDRGYFIQPTIFDGVQQHHRIFQEEIFGPVLSICTVSSFAEAVAAANNSDYGLSSSMYTQDVNRAFVAMRDLQAGITYINAPTIGAEAHMPFGGIKGTGNGHREGGWTVFDIFTEWKTVYVDFSGHLQRAQIDNQDS